MRSPAISRPGPASSCRSISASARSRTWPASSSADACDGSNMDELTEIKVIVARIEERQVALADKVGEAVERMGGLAPRAEIDHLAGRVSAIEQQQSWIVRGSMFGGTALLA